VLVLSKVWRLPSLLDTLTWRLLRRRWSLNIYCFNFQYDVPDSTRKSVFFAYFAPWNSTPTWSTWSFRANLHEYPVGVDSHPSEAVWFSGSILKDWRNYQSNEYEWPIITNVPTYQSYQEDPGGINIWQLWFSALVHSIVPTQKRRMISPPTPNLSRVYMCQKCCQKWPRPFTSWDDDSRCAKYFLGQNDQSIVETQFLTRNLGRKNFLTQIYPDCWRRQLITGVGPIENHSWNPESISSMNQPRELYT